MILIKAYTKIEHFGLRQAKKILDLFHVDFTNDMKRETQRILRFLAMGVANMFLSYSIYSGVIIMGGHYFGAGVASFIAGVLNTFYWNNSVIFKSIKTRSFTISIAFIKTIVGYIFTGFILQIMLLCFWIDFLNVNEFLAPFFNVIIIVPTNYLLNRYWIYK